MKRKILITGASRGIGKVTKELFEEKGHIVFAPSRNDMDLLDKDSVLSYCESVYNEGIEVIINNAGINDINLIEDVSSDEMESMIQINLISPTLIIGKLVPAMKTMGYGRIVNIGSIWSVVSKPGRSVYSITKNGIHGLTNTLAIELATYGILVNTVCPGYTLTELTRKNNTEKEIETISQVIPLNRMAEPIEIARIIHFLGSDNNSYITGQKIVADGGFSCQ